MRFTGGLAAVLCGTAIVIVSPLVAKALTASQVYSIAQEITVRIDGANTGSGIIVDRQGDSYTVVTCWHVVQLKGSYTIQTPDGRKYTINNSQVKQLGDVDLAVFQFSSNQNYRVAEKGDSDQVTGGKNVYVAGYPNIAGRNFQNLPGQISGRRQNPLDGYALFYTVQALGGMSGGPILDEEGKLVGIHGRAETDPGGGGTATLGIPLKTYLSLAPSAPPVAIKPTPQPTNPPQPVSTPPQIAVALTPTEISAKAEQITVRIDGKNDQNSGSGVIVERNGDNYVVITNWHVVDTSGNYTVQTSDGKRYAVNYSQVRQLPGVDIAILQFTSSQNYQIAEIGNSDEIKTGMNVYATGYPLPGPGTPKRSYRFLPGLISGRNPDAKNGYELTYTIEPIPGMSGGPIFNEQGQVVGIYGEGATDIRTGRVSLGLGIPINTYKKLASIEPETKPKPSNSNKDVEFFTQGYEKYKQGDLQGAIADYTQAIKINPNYAYAYYNRGSVRSDLGDNQGAIADYTQAIKINPNLAEAYILRGNARSDLGDKQGAIADNTQAIKINPNFAYAYILRGNARSDLGDKQGAIADNTQAIKINPNFAYAYFNRGNARRQLGDKQGAISDLQKAAELYKKQGNTVRYQKSLDLIKKYQQE